ncbi:MAG: hypothetical protein HY800_09145 [Ignavibacteriales bacterium]|nr:hypothetical protein [Ignavibacteriales bacterium]
MSFWKIAGFITGFVLVTLVARKCKCKPVFLKDPEKRYNVDDFLADQDL